MPRKHHPKKVAYNFWLDCYLLARIKQAAAENNQPTATFLAQTLEQVVGDIKLDDETIAEIQEGIKRRSRQG